MLSQEKQKKLAYVARRSEKSGTNPFPAVYRVYHVAGG